LDYANHDCLPYKDSKDILIYDSYAEVFHITNISFYREIINLETEFLNNHDSQNFLWEISNDLEIIKLLISQIIPNRSKRGITTIWKWIAGIPDHDDFINVQNKTDVLVQYNNDQFVINCKIFKEIKSLSDKDQEIPLRKYRPQITLAKIDVFNT